MVRRLISLVLVLAFMSSAFAQFTHQLTHLRHHAPTPDIAASPDHHHCGHHHCGADAEPSRPDDAPADTGHDHESCDLCDLLATLAPLDTTPTIVAPTLDRIAVVSTDLPDAAAAPVVDRERNRGPPVRG